MLGHKNRMQEQLLLHHHNRQMHNRSCLFHSYDERDIRNRRAAFRRIRRQVRIRSHRHRKQHRHRKSFHQLQQLMSGTASYRRHE
jgi:hypothetical protein